MGKTLRRFVIMGGAFALLGVGSGAAAPGGGAIVAPATCVISIPGSYTLTVAGRVVITPSGRAQTVCQGQLPAGAPAPPKALRFDTGPCLIVVAPSGSVHSSCNNG